MSTCYKILFFTIFCFLLTFGYMCDASADVPAIFETMARNTGTFAQGLRKIAMVLGAFGIIMFTFLAICGKINFKHLGYITICLFFLAGTAALIDYISMGEAKLPTEFRKGDTYTKSSNI